MGKKKGDAGSGEETTGQAGDAGSGEETKAAPGMVLLLPPKGTAQIGIPGEAEDEVLVFTAREDGLFEVAHEHHGRLIAHGFTVVED